MADEPIVRLIMREIEVKKTANKGDLRLNGGEAISPMNEALVALLRQHLSDAEIIKLAQEGTNLRQILAMDALFDSVPQSKKNNLHSVCAKKGIQQSIETAALLIADNKLSRDGKILHCAATKYDSGSGPEHYFMESLKYADPKSVYVDQSAVENLRKKCRLIKYKKTITSAIISCAITGAVLYGAFRGIHAFRHRKDADPEQVRIEELTKLANALQAKVNTYEQDKKALETVVSSTKEELEITKSTLKETTESYNALKKVYDAGRK